MVRSTYTYLYKCSFNPTVVLYIATKWISICRIFMSQTWTCFNKEKEKKNLQRFQNSFVIKLKQELVFWNLGNLLTIEKRYCIESNLTNTAYITGRRF